MSSPTGSKMIERLERKANRNKPMEEELCKKFISAIKDEELISSTAASHLVGCMLAEWHRKKIITETQYWEMMGFTNTSTKAQRAKVTGTQLRTLVAKLESDYIVLPMGERQAGQQPGVNIAATKPEVTEPDSPIKVIPVQTQKSSEDSSRSPDYVNVTKLMEKHEENPKNEEPAKENANVPTLSSKAPCTGNGATTENLDRKTDKEIGSSPKVQPTKPEPKLSKGPVTTIPIVQPKATEKSPVPKAQSSKIPSKAPSRTSTGSAASSGKAQKKAGFFGRLKNPFRSRSRSKEKKAAPSSSSKGSSKPSPKKIRKKPHKQPGKGPSSVQSWCRLPSRKRPVPTPAPKKIDPEKVAQPSQQPSKSLNPVAVVPVSSPTPAADVNPVVVVPVTKDPPSVQQHSYIIPSDRTQLEHLKPEDGQPSKGSPGPKTPQRKSPKTPKRESSDSTAPKSSSSVSRSLRDKPRRKKRHRKKKKSPEKTNEVEVDTEGLTEFVIKLQLDPAVAEDSQRLQELEKLEKAAKVPLLDEKESKEFDEKLSEVCGEVQISYEMMKEVCQDLIEQKLITSNDKDKILGHAREWQTMGDVRKILDSFLKPIPGKQNAYATVSV